MAASASVPTSLPPVAHAIGGCVGSTISILLLYPLERVRIEMQAHVLTMSNSISDQEQLEDDDNNHGNDNHNDVDHHDCNALNMDMDMDMDIDNISSSASEDANDILYNSSGSDKGTQQLQGHKESREGDNASPSSSNFSFEVVSQQSSKSQSSPQLSQPLSPSHQIAKRTLEEIKTTSTTPQLKTKPALPGACTNKKTAQNIKNPSLLATLYHLHVQKTLYKGSTPIAFTLAISNFIFFYTLQATKQIFHETSASLLTSTIAGVINVLLTNPFWVANLRLVKNNEYGDKYKGLFHCVREIWRKEGPGQLWAGLGASLLLVSNPAIQYYVYEKVKLDLMRNRNFGRVALGSSLAFSLTPTEAFCVGALAKGVATVMTYPLQLAQVLMRLQKNESIENEHSNNGDSGDEKTSPSPQLSPPVPTKEGKQISRGGGNSKLYTSREHSKMYNNLFDCIFTLYRQGGIRALFSGMHAKLLQTVLTSAITFLTYEQILDYVAKSYWLFSKKLES